MVFTAPAKLNLYLKVIARRNDGYHEIETLFEKVSIFDRLSVELTDGPTTISCDNPLVPTGEDSLLARSVKLFNSKLKKSPGFRISLEKEIPIGGGLGGGSSDAGTLLKAVNEITGSPLDGASLCEIARKLGADVPFFLEDSSFALGRGRGDMIERIESSLDIWHILVNPGFEVSTKEVYAKISLRLRRIEIKKKLQGSFFLTKKNGLDRMFTAFLNGNDMDSITKNLHNDLQRAVLRDFPVLEKTFSELRNLGAKGMLLTGSGPTVFGIFDQSKIIKAKEEAEKVFPAEDNWKTFVVHTYR